ncbi:hypothetical protein DH2020_007767 [Rehmannia glutinosa]|uniref:GDSL esterase/lipase n=1 Tax=Rehmannia glutinosa TaxID=99300 RepID=A0ABR0TZ31_REHGL
MWVVFPFWCLAASKAYSQPNNQVQQVPCLFIFGDSLVDNGNNNGILTLARANYMPYGIDFPQGATGRFTNGRTFVDILAQLLGFPNYILPYARARGRALLQGANYASGASGIRDETGNNLGDHMSMNQQVDSFGNTVQQLRRCNEEINSAIVLFNTGLKSLVDRFNKAGQLPGAKFVYLDSYQSSQDLVKNAKTYGFEVVDKGCCGVGRNNGQITCLPLETPCDNRRSYLFWDAFHPTEAANILLAKKAYTSNSKSYAYPINIQQLAML